MSRRLVGGGMSRRLRIVRIPMCDLVDALVDSSTSQYLPKGGRCVDVWVDRERMCLAMIYEHDSFDEVLSGYLIPTHRWSDGGAD